VGEKLRVFTSRELEQLLSRYGFELISQRGVIENGEIWLPDARSLFRFTPAETCRSARFEIFLPTQRFPNTNGEADQ
jgi:hypothetical protein